MVDEADAVCRPGNEGKNRTDFYRTLNDYCRQSSVSGYLGADFVIKDFELNKRWLKSCRVTTKLSGPAQWHTHKNFMSVHHIFTSNRECHFFVFHQFKKDKIERNKAYCTAVCAGNACDMLTQRSPQRANSSTVTLTQRPTLSYLTFVTHFFVTQISNLYVNPCSI